MEKEIYKYCKEYEIKMHCCNYNDCAFASECPIYQENNIAEE